MSPEPVDLRSDTVTRPTPAMREAIASAEVGDASLGDDPTTARLEERVAELLGKERALFFPSGVMANQTALAVLGRPGTEVVVEAGAHVLHYEEGAAAALSGLQLRPVPGDDGLLTAEAVQDVVRSGSPYMPETSAVAVENTHLDSGGRVMPLEVAGGIRRVAGEHGLGVHLDGARLWHATAASGTPLSDYAAQADTVMVALSKGLGCPVGSMLAGSSEIMRRAWRVRRRFGGGMRQTGILAAAGLHALDHHLDRLETDHENARLLAEGLRAVDGVEVTPPETNIVLIDVSSLGVSPGEILGFLKKHGILMIEFGPNRIRAVTHLNVDRTGIKRAVEVFHNAVAGHSGTL